MTRAENPPAYLERLRDEFAMAALVAQYTASTSPPEDFSEHEWAKAAYSMADAMLAARQGGGHE